MYLSNINSEIQEVRNQWIANQNLDCFFEATKYADNVNTIPSRSKAGWRRARRETVSWEGVLQKQIENAINNERYEDVLQLIDRLKESVDPKLFNIFANLVKANCLKMLDRPTEAFLYYEKSIQEIGSEADQFKKRCREEINRLHKEGRFLPVEIDQTIRGMDEFIDRNVQVTRSTILESAEWQKPPIKYDTIRNLRCLTERTIDSIFTFGTHEDPEYPGGISLVYHSIWSELGLQWKVSVEVSEKT